MRSTATVDKKVKEGRKEEQKEEPEVRDVRRIRVPMAEGGEPTEVPAEEALEPDDAGVDEEELERLRTPVASESPTPAEPGELEPRLIRREVTDYPVEVRCNWPATLKVLGKVTGVQYVFSGGIGILVHAVDVPDLESRSNPRLNRPLFERV